MAATAARDARRKASDVISYKLGAVKVYKGTLISVRADGYAYPARSGTSTDVFVGVAQTTVDNSGGSAGDKEIVVETKGTYVFLKASAVITDVGLAFYASADDTLTATSTNNQLVGYGVGLEGTSTTTLRICIDAAAK